MSEADAANTTPAEEPKVESTEEQKPVEEVKTETTEEQKPADAPEAAKDGAEEKKSAADVLKTKGRIDYENPKNNRKFDPSARGVTDDPDAIRKQVEFYFGDWNFPQDKFMWEQAGGPENKPIAIKKIHSFKRMRSFQPYSAVVAALRDSKLLVVEGDVEGEEVVKRKTPYVPQSQSRAKTEASTVYVKGFGDETPTTQFDVESFFANFGEVKGLKLRRTNEGFFKGSVFVTFADEETAEKFMKTDPAPKWEGHDLKIMSKRAYCEEKNELIRQGKLEPNSTAPKKFFEGKEGPKGGRADKDDWKRRRDSDQKNGFRDRRGGGRGRGGRGRGGRGRGGRDGGRDNRRRDNNEEGSRDTKTEDATHGKRAREEDGSAQEPAAKKVDVKADES